MSIKIARPTDDYSPDWAEYWEQNPHMLRSVGAEAAENEGGDGEGDKGDDVDYKSLVAKLEAQNKELAEKAQTFEAKHREAEKHRKAKEEEAKKAAMEAAAKAGDVDAVISEWQGRLSEANNAFEEERKQYKSIIYNRTVRSEAMALASKIAMDGCAEGLYDHIAKRLEVEIDGGDAVVKVKSKDGKLLGSSIEDLEKELKATPYLAPLIKGSSASGGGGLNGKGTAGKGEISREDFDKLPAHEKPKVAREKRIV